MTTKYKEEATEDLVFYLPFWKQLKEEEKAYVIDRISIRHYKKGAIIYGCKDVCLGMICVLSGSIRVSLLSEEGREITLFRLERGDPCVLSAACVMHQITFDTQMEAEQDCDLAVIDSGAFQYLTEKNIYVKCFMYELITERFSSVMWTMQQILFAKMDQRLAGFLIKEYDRTNEPKIRMTQEQIAQQINSAREVVARMLRRFVSDGLVEVRRGEILLKDPERLRKI